MHSPLSLAVGYEKVVTHEGRPRNRVVVRFAGLEDPVLRIFARVLVAVFVAIAVAAAVFVPSVGLLVGAAYLLSAAVFAYAGFSREAAAIVRVVVAAMGSFFLVSGLAVAIAMSILGFPFEGRGWVVGLAHAAFGGLAMAACAVLLPCDDESAPR
jgi:hypothetical protein